MPAPDPHGLEYDEHPDGRPIIRAEVWPSSGWFPGNPRHRNARAKAVLVNILRGGWLCPICGDPVPTHKRADARYCREACRKKAARARRQELTQAYSWPE